MQVVHPLVVMSVVMNLIKVEGVGHLNVMRVLHSLLVMRVVRLVVMRVVVRRLHSREHSFLFFLFLPLCVSSSLW